jgi:hypothetical protein
MGAILSLYHFLMKAIKCKFLKEVYVAMVGSSRIDVLAEMEISVQD